MLIPRKARDPGRERERICLIEHVERDLDPYRDRCFSRGDEHMNQAARQRRGERFFHVVEDQQARLRLLLQPSPRGRDKLVRR